MTTVAMKMNAGAPVRNLALLLLAQVVLAAGLLAWQGRGGVAEPKALFDFDVKTVDRLVIEGPDEAKVDLQRRGSGDTAQWVVTQAGDFPADGSRVRRVLDQLHGLQVTAPVATSAAAAERFKVADEDFERRIRAEAGGRFVATLLLGSSQGSRQTSARKGGEDEVYAVDWATYDVATRSEDWLDKGVLSIAEEDVTGVEVDGKELDEEARKRVAQALAGLYFQNLRGTGDEARRGLGKLELQLVVQRRQGEPVTYTSYRLPDTEDRALVVSNRPEVFTLSAVQAGGLKGAVGEGTSAGT